MLAAAHRLRSRTDFTRIVRQGRKVKQGLLVVHALPPQGSHTRFGFIVGKSVGNSVIRHRVTRRLRAASADQLPDMAVPADVVIRALPGIDRVPTADLAQALRRALITLEVTRA